MVTETVTLLNEEDVDLENGPIKLSDQLLEAYEDDEISLTISRKVTT